MHRLHYLNFCYNLLSYKMHINLYVFCSTMKHLNWSQCSYTQLITHHCWIIIGNLNFSQQSSYPSYFSRHLAHYPIVRFCKRQSDNVLLSRTPLHYVLPKIHTKTTSRPSISNIPSPICICICLNFKLSHWFKQNATTKSTSNVS